jgi:hypothetical protein
MFLNDDFLESFNTNESNRILNTEIVNFDNPYFGTNGGNSTRDKVFLLSISEFVEYFGGENKFKSKLARWRQQIPGGIVQAPYGGWILLRSPGMNNRYAALGSYSDLDFFLVQGTNVTDDDFDINIMPCLWFDISE